MKKIVVSGGGFAGVATVIALRKHIPSHEATIILIDKNPYHLFTPSLYEVATSEEPQKNIAIPFSAIFGQQIRLVKGFVERIDPKEQTIMLRNQEPVSYDYLVVTLGSQPAYYAIPGLKEHSIPFKTLKDAMEIKRKIKTQCCKEGKCDRKVQILIGGGGFSGTELAAELLTYKDRIARQNGLDQNCLQITIIQGSNRLLKELDSHVSDLAQKRLKGPNVRFAFGGHINKVTDTEVFTDNGKSYPYHLFIWTGGVKANHIPARSGLPVTKRDAIIVNQYLQAQGFENIFVAGDVAGFVDQKTNEPAPNVAQVAEEEGSIAGENVARLLQHKSLKPYPYRHFGYVVPLKGKFAVAELMGGLHFDGFLGWVLQQIVLLRYLLGILPLPSAMRSWNTFESELEQ